MATLLDIGLFQHFGIVFMFLLIFFLFYGILSYLNVLGKDNKGLHAWIALALAALFVMSDVAVLTLGFVTPWFILLALVIFLILISFRMMGVSETDILNAAKVNEVKWTIIIVGIIIVLFALGNAMGQGLLEEQDGTGSVGGNTEIIGEDVVPGGIEVSSDTDTGDYQSNLVNTIFHPKVLGLLFILLIATFTMTLGTR
ncbi:hypothetical protein CMO92_04560 [Candidatus Woesearchaeota archaeon]|nr:hypothetical protein [Candidatus Woesearchaeota archaeon]|tara:strand:+ start:138 stop:734 length:597 start_codon:yes stop_codon:yes gene_type:complete